MNILYGIISDVVTDTYPRKRVRVTCLLVLDSVKMAKRMPVIGMIPGKATSIHSDGNASV